MSLLDILINPDPILRQPANPLPLKEIKDSKFKDFLSNMAETMLAKDGIGLAAPQVGVSDRIIVVSTKGGPMAMINPEITKKSITKEWDEEGCLSVPHTFGKVKRHKQIHCKFINSDGELKKIAAQGLFARVIQHEIDHLDGILFIDKAKDITTDKYQL